MSHSSIRSDRVYRLPVDQSQSQLSPRSRRRASQLRLPPQQEYMRSAIARSLAPPSSSPTPQLERVILGKKWRFLEGIVREGRELFFLVGGEERGV